MAGSYSVTISNLSTMSIGPNRRSEATEIEETVRRYLQVMVAGNMTSITMKDRSGNTVGTMSWTPLNSA